MYLKTATAIQAAASQHVNSNQYLNLPFKMLIESEQANLKYYYKVDSIYLLVGTDYYYVRLDRPVEPISPLLDLDPTER